MKPAVVADANVLYSVTLRDILIELHLAGVIVLHWSPRILQEMAAALVSTRIDYAQAKANDLIQRMNEALPDASITESPDWPLSLPDPKDEHVLMAAVARNCTHLLTFNLRDFPADRIKAACSLTVISPTRSSSCC